jgi:hypothetical protein
MKCVCVEDVEHECVEKSERQYECKEIKKRRFNCMTQYVDKIIIKQFKKEIDLTPIVFTCNNATLSIIEIYPKMLAIHEFKDAKILEVWL